MDTNKTNDPGLDEPAANRSTWSIVFVALAALVLLFVGVLAFVSSQPADAAVSPEGVSADVASTCDGICCGNGEDIPAATGEARVEGDVQRIDVDVSKGYFDPSQITLESGMPAEIVFGTGSGCMAEVMFEDFGILEDLRNGGTTISLPAMEPGIYEFSCGMRMVYGSLVVK